MKVDIYRKLNDPKGQGKTWPILDRTTRRVVGRVNDGVIVDNVRFGVQPAGHAKVIAQEQKNVHAFVRGDSSEIAKSYHMAMSKDWVEVTYKPFEHDYFYRTDTGEAVYEADWVYIDEAGVFMNKN